MNINIIGTGIFRSGGMRIIFEYANMLVEKGHDVCYYYPIKPYDFYRNVPFTLNKFKNIVRNFLDMFRINSLLRNLYTCKFRIKIVPSIRNIFIREAACIIATQWPTAYSVSNLGISKGKKFYFVQDYETWNSDLEMVKDSYLLPLEIITVSNYLHQILKEKFNRISKIVLNSIDVEFFKCPQKSPFSNSIINITFIDHYLEKKGVDTVLNAISELNSKFTNLHFTAFGYQKYHKIPEYVDFIINPDDIQIKEIYSRTDIFIFSSLVEGFGLPPAEAMACKCAVVTTPVGAIPDFCVDGNNSILFVPGDNEDLEKKISLLIEDPSKGTKIANNAEIDIRNKLSRERSFMQFSNIIENN